jgi:tRNA G18 (ribose-2'-O)-methylase SpoU
LGRCIVRFPRRFQSVQVVICGEENEWNCPAVTRSANCVEGNGMYYPTPHSVEINICFSL